MPTYEFSCKACGHRFEMFTSISAKEKGLDLSCSQCGGREIKQAVTGFMFYSPGAHAASEHNHSTSSSCSCSGCHGKSCQSCH